MGQSMRFEPALFWRFVRSCLCGGSRHELATRATSSSLPSVRVGSNASGPVDQFFRDECSRPGRTFGPIVDLVVGHFGDWSSGLERLLAAAAEDAAPRSRALFGARSPSDSRGRCAWFFRREVAWAGLNANARLKLERAGFVAWDARSAAARREEDGSVVSEVAAVQSGNGIFLFPSAFFCS